eukprot:CAMPEP_0172664486 /NCGR_PEP_ID=MMETSP1074-20121228/6635_1 /TAXON_ID=2916 /ORGANISM="Ceratium fusus, Strain PA161109" /LENGTH=61 /DNA_ID=CAMNT_0013480647 /DNA_START=123 /DNA_END=311 /DNA_ORIENTATION=+
MSRQTANACNDSAPEVTQILQGIACLPLRRCAQFDYSEAVHQASSRLMLAPQLPPLPRSHH